MKIKKMLGNRVLLRRHPVETTVGSAGIILAPENRIDQSLRCTVVQVGPGSRVNGVLRPTSVKPGDVVVLTTFSGDKIEPLEDPSLLIVDEAWIEAVLPAETPDSKALEMING